MKKRGQITIFIIIAIVIIVISILFFMFYSKIKESFVSREDSIYLFAESCIEDVGRDAIYLISQKGGYFISPNLSNSDGIAYYYFDNKNYMPSQKKVEDQISLYIETMLPLCTQDFINFPSFEITQGEIKTETKIREKEVILNVKYPFAIEKGGSLTKFENFKNIKIPVRLGVIYNAVKEIIQDQLTHKNICLSCISKIALENELKVDLTTIENDILFTFTDEESQIKNVALKFNFVNNYL